MHSSFSITVLLVIDGIGSCQIDLYDLIIRRHLKLIGVIIAGINNNRSIVQYERHSTNTNLEHLNFILHTGEHLNGLFGARQIRSFFYSV